MREFVAFLVTIALLAWSRESTSRVFVTDTCHVDAPAREAVVAAYAPLNFGGWEYDGKTGLPPARVPVEFISSDRRSLKPFDAKRGTERPDVVVAHNAPGVDNSGFGETVPARALPPGPHELLVLQDLPTGLLVCSNVHAISVK